MKKYLTQLSVITLMIISIGCNPQPTNTDNDMSQNDIADVTNDSSVIERIRVENPKTIENLSLFILTGEEKINGKSYTTLSEAMKNKEVIVNETGNVNTLSIDNNSEAYIFINSGDIVKGGKQDRTISYDVIVPPKTKNIPLESFCVEQDRWQQRNKETATSFGSNTKMLSSRDLKLAAKYEKDQGKVWRKISEHKSHLNEKLSEKNGYIVNVANNQSNSSLQLALESRELDSIKNQFYTQLESSIHTPNAIGYAYAINGEIYGVEIYNNRQLFKDLWKKILESLIVEAISKQEDARSFSIRQNEVINYMNAIKINDTKTTKEINKVTELQTLESNKGNIMFTTKDTYRKHWVHKSYMKGDTISTLQTERNSLR